MMVVQNRKVERNWGSHILPSGWNKLESFEHHSHPPHSYFINIFIRGHNHHNHLSSHHHHHHHHLFSYHHHHLFGHHDHHVQGETSWAQHRGLGSQVWLKDPLNRGGHNCSGNHAKKKILGGWDIFTLVPSKLWNQYHKLSIEEDTMPK